MTETLKAEAIERHKQELIEPAATLPAGGRWRYSSLKVASPIAFLERWKR